MDKAKCSLKSGEFNVMFILLITVELRNQNTSSSFLGIIGGK